MRRTTLGIASGLALAVCVAPETAAAQGVQQPCGDRDAIVDKLTSKWGEAFMGGGLHSASSLFEVWMSAEKGTWTILRTEPNGRACVMATGTNWLDADPNAQVAGIEG